MSRTLKHLPEALQFLGDVHPLDSGAQCALADALSYHQQEAPAYITRIGHIQKQLLFLESGIHMSLCFDDKGREHVMAFAYPPGLSGIPESFLQQSPSAYELRTLEAGAFFALHVQDYHRLLQTHAGFESMMRKMIEQMFIGMLQRHRAWQTLSMEARFQAFMQRSGWLLHRAPQKYLASYLNIDPTNFSKLLRRTSW